MLFDDTYPEEYQPSAQGKVFMQVFKAVRALRGMDGTVLGNDSLKLLFAIQDLLDVPVPADVKVLHANPPLEELIAILESGDGTPRSVAQMEEPIRAGIYALEQSREKGPRFWEAADIWFGYLRKAM